MERDKPLLRIAIDGPAGAGKSTVAKKVAFLLNYLYVDTGAMYRALSYYALKNGIPLEDADSLGEMARRVQMRVEDSDGVFRVFIDGFEVTSFLRSHEMDQAVKILAMARPVREVLVETQRDLAKKGGVVMEGRDIGSVVMPNAEVKVFLTASLRERARRRWKELSRNGEYRPWEDVLQEMRARDAKDLERSWGKLVKMPDAVLIDDSGKTIDEVVEIILGLCCMMGSANSCVRG